MNNMYAEQIIKATRCGPEDVGRIEEIMRSYVLGRALNGVPLRPKYTKKQKFLPSDY